MVAVSEAAAKSMHQEHKEELKALRAIVENESQQEETAINAMYYGENVDRAREMKEKILQRDTPLEMLKKNYLSWLSNLPCFGYNSSKYDLMVAREHIITYIEEKLGGVQGVIKKGNQYRALYCSGLTFLDVMSYLPPNTTCSSYLKSHNVSEEKFFFPYEAFTSLEYLSKTTLPPREEFYSSLTISDLTPEQYLHCQQTWKKHNFASMKDFLVHYNNADTIGMLKALQIQSSY